MRSFIVLALAFCPAIVAASPAISVLEPAAVEKQTDAVVRLTIVSRVVTQLEGKPPIQVTTIEARVDGASGRKASALPVGTLLRFESRCSKEAEPLGRMSGYPNGRCGTGWTALPAGFADAQAKTVEARLIVGEGGAVSVVPTTRPVTGSLHGKIVPAKPTR